MLLHELRVGRGLREPLTGIGPRRILSRLLLILRIHVHGRLDLGRVESNIVQHPLLQCPPKEVQLPDGSHEGRRIRDLEHDPLPTAKGVEELLAVGLQLRLVVRVDEELLAVQNI